MFGCYTSANREHYFSLCNVHSACEGSQWKALITFSIIPTSIISISQSSLSCWGGRKIQPIKVFSTDLTRRHWNVSLLSPILFSHLFYSRTCYNPRKYTIVHSAFHTDPYTNTLTHTNRQGQEDLADGHIQNQSQSRQRDTEDQPNKTGKLRC